MKSGHLLFAAAAASAALFALAAKGRADEPVRVTNVRFTADSMRVVITYDLSAPQDGEVDVHVRLRRESQRSFLYTPKLLAGDVGRGRFAGTGRSITWESK